MLVSKKEHEQLKKKVDEQEKVIQEIMFHLSQQAQEIQELKKPKQPNYFG